MTADAVVHVIDDDEAVRQSLEFLLGTADFKVRTYDSASAFLEVLPQVQSGCVITDVRMPGMTGIELLQRIQAMERRLPVIVITGHGEVPLAVEAMQIGAVDFLEKPFDEEVLLSAVDAALRRDDKQDGREAERHELAERIARLPSLERQVLEGLITGHPNKTIAFDLGLSPRTVEICRANVITKMKAASLSDLVRMALIAGLLPDRPEAGFRGLR